MNEELSTETKFTVANKKRRFTVSMIDLAPMMLLIVGLLLGFWGIVDERISLTILSIILILHAVEIRLILLVFIAVTDRKEHDRAVTPRTNGEGFRPVLDKSRNL